MKTPLIVSASLMLLLGLGCSARDREIQEKEAAEARARAEATRKEMDTLPKAFQTPNYFKKNEPAKKTEAPSPVPTTPTP